MEDILKLIDDKNTLYKLNNIIQKIYSHNKQKNQSYTYEKAINDLKIYIEKQNIKIINNHLLIKKNITQNEYKFPKIIHLTCPNKNNIDNQIWLDCLERIKYIYPDYVVKLYDDNDIYNLIEKYDKKNLDSIKRIKIGAILADIFRYLILYLDGGIYCDMDCYPTKSINTIFDSTHFHGNTHNYFHVHKNKSQQITHPSCNFYENPCNNCKLINTTKIADTYVCMGHKYVNTKTNIIVGTEFDSVWNSNIINDETIKHKWVDNNIGICQWFIITKPKQKLFLKCYKKSIKHIDKIVELDRLSPTFHYDVINTTGPLLFTKIINYSINYNKVRQNEISILPADFFCSGSGGTVPETKNTYIKHKFTGTWLKNEPAKI